MSKAKTSTTSAGFDAQLQQVKQLVQEIQQGEGTFEQTVTKIETAAKLIQECRNYLEQTSLTLDQVLLDADTGELTEEPFELED